MMKTFSTVLIMIQLCTFAKTHRHQHLKINTFIAYQVPLKNVEIECPRAIMTFSFIEYANRTISCSFYYLTLVFYFVMVPCTSNGLQKEGTE